MDHATLPVPQQSISPPTVNADLHCLQDGNSLPLSHNQAYISTPARVNLYPSSISAGIVSIATRIARYVDPQMKYSAIKQSTIKVERDKSGILFYVIIGPQP